MDKFRRWDAEGHCPEARWDVIDVTFLSTCAEALEAVNGTPAIPEPVYENEVTGEELNEADARFASNEGNNARRIAPEN